MRTDYTTWPIEQLNRRLADVLAGRTHGPRDDFGRRSDRAALEDELRRRRENPEPNPWQPETDALSLAILGKLAEELGEAGAAVARCIIQGIEESEPVTGKPNRQWLADELADVEAQIAVVKARFLLDGVAMAARTARKIEHVRAWHKMIGSNR